MPRILTAALNLKAQGILLIIALAGCFTLAALAEVIGLAAIVGAFRGRCDYGESPLPRLC